MDDPRSVLQAPAEVSDLGRFLPSRSSKLVGFSCRACGGNECTVETYGGGGRWLVSLREYQLVGDGDLLGTYNVYTCARCAGHRRGNAGHALRASRERGEG